MATYKTPYEAVMTGMRGDDVRMSAYDIDWYLLRAIKFLSVVIEPDETVCFVTCNSSVDWFYEEREALKWACDVHPGNTPGCYQVSKSKRGYRVKTLYEA